jgi:hypothetical protein
MSGSDSIDQIKRFMISRVNGYTAHSCYTHSNTHITVCFLCNVKSNGGDLTVMTLQQSDTTRRRRWIESAARPAPAFWNKRYTMAEYRSVPWRKIS